MEHLARDDSVRRNSRGGSTTSLQLNLRPKNETSHSTADSLSVHSLELGHSKETLGVSSLLPVDEGFGAWSYATSAFFMFIVVWGFPQSFPIFQTYLSSGEVAQHPDSVVLPLLASGIQDILEGLLFPILPRSTAYRQYLVFGGIMVIVTSLFLASSATTAWQIVLTQGVLFGIGGIMLNFVHVSLCSEWFVKKKGKAMGIIWLGWRVGGLGFPPICQWLLEKHGYEQTLRVLIAPMVTLLLPCILAFRGRFPSAEVQTPAAQPKIGRFTALGKPNILFYLFVALLFSFVINVPTLFITRYGADLGLQRSDQAWAFSLRILSSMSGIYLFGFLSDHGLHHCLLIASAFATSLVHFLVWGFVKSREGLFIYAILIGCASGGYDNGLHGIFHEIAGSSNELYTTVHSTFSFFRGIAILSVGPVGVAILRYSPVVVLDEYAIGKYKYLILYAGGMSMASGLLALLKLRYKETRSTK